MSRSAGSVREGSRWAKRERAGRSWRRRHLAGAAKPKTIPGDWRYPGVATIVAATFTAERLVHRSGLAIVAFACVFIACASSGGTPRGTGADNATTSPADGATLAQIFFWRAKRGKLDEYTRYIRERAEPIDAEARRAGAFLSVTTYQASDTTVPWTHMRVFMLRDSTQLVGLADALTAAGARVEPDSVKRRQQSDYSATLRDRVGATVVQIVR
jgi:hypothetical protein